MAQLWCRQCGSDIFEEGLQLALDGIESFKLPDARSNILMLCLYCLIPGSKASPTASRVQDRVLYHLVTKGVVRVGIAPKVGYWEPPPGIVFDEVTEGHEGTARNYIGSAVAGIQHVWASTHIHPAIESHMGYALGHLRTTNAPCRCKMR
jgi:hypothetical protein